MPNGRDRRGKERKKRSGERFFRIGGIDPGIYIRGGILPFGREGLLFHLLAGEGVELVVAEDVDLTVNADLINHW